MSIFSLCDSQVVWLPFAQKLTYSLKGGFAILDGLPDQLHKPHQAAPFRLVRGLEELETSKVEERVGDDGVV